MIQCNLPACSSAKEIVVSSQHISSHLHIAPNPLSEAPRLLRIHLTLRLIPTSFLDDIKRRRSPIQLAPAASARSSLRVILALELRAHADGLVPPEALAHVHHAALAVAEPALQLLAGRREGVEERRGQALGGRVAGDEDAVRVLETGGQCGADVFAGGGHGGDDGNWEGRVDRGL